MRAVLTVDAEKGPGYGVISVYDIGELADPLFVLWRASDNFSLADGGWRAGSHTLPVENWDIGDDGAHVFLGPDVVNELVLPGQYEFEITGMGRCALAVDNIYQSKVVEDNGADFTAPPPANPFPTPEPPAEDEIIREGVEITPDDSAADPIRPEGNPDEAAVAVPPSAKKKRGCLVLMVLMLFVWLGCGWALWNGAMNTPPARGTDEEVFFEIIPKSSESSFVENSPETDSEEKSPAKPSASHKM